MKKFSVLLIVAALLFLGGCEDAKAALSNGKEALITFDGGKITRQDVYELVGRQDSGKTLMSLLNTAVAEKEVETTDEIKTAAQKILDDAKEEYGDDFNTYISYYGYTSEQQYMDEYCIPTAKFDKLGDTYLEKDWDSIVENYWPARVQMMEIAKDKDYATALSRVKGGEDFKTVASEFTTSSATLFDGAEHLVSRLDESSLASNLISFIQTNPEGSLSEILVGASEDNVYIVKIVSKDTLKLKAEFTEALKASSSFNTEATAYYLKKNNFHVYDIDFLNFLKENYPTYINQ